MANIFGGFSGFDLAMWGKLIMYLFLFIVFAVCMTAIVIMIAVKKKQTKIIEINMLNKRMRFLAGRNKKTRKGIRTFWAGKLKRALPNFQQKDFYLKGSQDAIILLKDNNGMLHTARIPTFKQIKEWYKVIYKIDIDEKNEKGDYKHAKKLRNIYFLPTPHEDLDWLANQCAEAEKHFKVEHWWQSPVVAYVGCGLVCFMILFLGIISKKFGW